MYSPCVTSGYSVGQQRPPFNVVCLRHLASSNISADIPISISLITWKIFLVLYSLLYVWFANSKKILKNSHFKIYSPVLPLCSFNYFMVLRIKNYSVLKLWSNIYLNIPALFSSLHVLICNFNIYVKVITHIKITFPCYYSFFKWDYKISYISTVCAVFTKVLNLAFTHYNTVLIKVSKFGSDRWVTEITA